ncbi:MAG: DUF3822 family protein [Muribaculaceae bacterium]|nr:DUF3822 family protein [Muribaculaceae bacterium]MBR6432296.1 DUF3822 family protein [Muribaculaceae bacterium]
MTNLPALAVDIDRDKLFYLIYAHGVKPTMATIELNKSDDLKQAIENAVYDTPLLLEEYSHTTIALHSQHFVVMPAELTPSAKQVFQASFSSLEGELMTCPVKNTDATIACDVPQGVTAFLSRTFGNPELLHHLAPLIAYCAEAYADENGCLHININDHEAHLVATLGGKLQIANTYPYRSLNDVIYFALAAFKECRFDNRADKILLTGDNDLLSQLAEQLRQRIAYVMPEVFPAQALTTLGNEAITYPFNLITTALY